MVVVVGDECFAWSVVKCCEEKRKEEKETRSKEKLK